MAALNLILRVMVITSIPLIANVRLTVAAIGLLSSGLAYHITTAIAYAKGKAWASGKAILESAIRKDAGKPSPNMEKSNEKNSMMFNISQT